MRSASPSPPPRRLGRPPDDADTAALTDLARSLPAPVALVDEVAQDRTVSTSTYYAAAMAILFVFLAAQFGVTSLHAEQRAKTLARMVAAPMRWPVSILAGKTLVSMVLAAGLDERHRDRDRAVLLGARWGDPVAVGALLLAARPGGDRHRPAGGRPSPGRRTRPVRRSPS